MKKAYLILDNGAAFEGESFGFEAPAGGEVVFNTAMTGYPESLTDPSYAGQIMVLTYPLVGNYGVPPRKPGEGGIPLYMESPRIHAEALVVADYSEAFSHWNAAESLSDWLKSEKIPAITGVDTRSLTKMLRERGVMLGRIAFDKSAAAAPLPDYSAINYVDKVSCKEVAEYGAGKGKKRVVLVDCGVKANILRCLLKRGAEVVRVPWNFDFTAMDYDGLFISNGPGNPDMCGEAVENIRKAIEIGKPIFGICMGNQLLAKAGGGKVYKLKYGHRSHNQPVRMAGTNRCFITSQNHGYAVDSSSLGKDWLPYFENINDGSNEGIRHASKPFFSVQFHPEAASGPTDTEFLFDEFVKLL